MAAEVATPEKIAFFVRHTSGVICVPLTGERLDELDLPLMVARQHRGASARRSPSRVDYRHGTTTGISAADRARHGPGAHRPGHPARRPRPARPHLPAALPRGRRAQAGRPHRGRRRPRPHGRPLPGRACSCEIVNDDGTMARVPELERVRRGARPAAHLDRRPHPLPPPEREAGAAGRRGPHPHRVGRLHLLRLRVAARRRAARRARQGRGAGRGRTCSCGCTASASPATCSARCAATAASQLDAAMERIAEEGRGVVVYLRGHEGRGIGIGHKIRAYSLQDAGPRHRRGQRRARPARRQPRVRHRRADPRRPRHHHDAAA